MRCGIKRAVSKSRAGYAFLDEIGEISPALQAKLLRFLQGASSNGSARTEPDVPTSGSRRDQPRSREGCRGGALPRRPHVSAQRHRDPRSATARARARHLAPREKLCAFFARAAGRTVPELTADAEAALLAYRWPGNVRELRNAMERAMILWPAQRIGAEALPGRIPGWESICRFWVGTSRSIHLSARARAPRPQRAPTLDDAARILGIDASTLWRKRKKYDV